MKILNLYAGIGGNRRFWGNEHDITAVEYNDEIASIYQDFFPGDKVVVGDAHEYLLKNFADFDFIWASPPCPTHSSIRLMTTKMTGKYKREDLYPDMSLYQEIIMLKHSFDGKWVVENVTPYYEPLIRPTVIIDRHYFWCNFQVPTIRVKKDTIIRNTKGSDIVYGIDLSNYRIKHRKDKILRNQVNPEIGLHFFNRAFDIIENSKVEHLKLF